jgi:catechol 2,3-dioxygenase-like lactoylglutathione lyase family enzyme
VDVLSSRILIHPLDRPRSRQFYEDVLGLAVYREFGDAHDPGVVFYLGGGFLEISGSAATTTRTAPRVGDQAVVDPPHDTRAALWLQVRDVAAEHARLSSAGLPIVRAPRQEPWGLIEMWIADPDGRPIVLVQVPEQHPLRRDQRDPEAS